MTAASTPSTAPNDRPSHPFAPRHDILGDDPVTWGEQIAVIQSELLEAVARGCSLETCLVAIAAAVSSLQPATRGYILLPAADGKVFARSFAADPRSPFGDGVRDAPISTLAIGTCGQVVYRGEPAICTDIAADDRWAPAWRELCLEHGIRACRSEPILGSAGTCLGSLMLAFDEAREASQRELQIARFGTRIAAIAIERDQAERERAYFVDRQRRMFDQAPGFMCMFEGPEHICTFANAAHRRLLGHEDLIGKPVRQVFPEFADQGFVELLDRVYATGERYVAKAAAVRLRTDPAGTERELYLDFVYEPVVDGAGRVVGIACEGHDVTEAIATREALRRSEARQGFLLALGDRLRRLSDPAEVTLAAAEMLGRHLGVARAGYGELDSSGEVIRVERDWAGRLPSLAGEARLLDGFGTTIAAELRAGRTLRVDDSAADPRASGQDVAETWASIDLRAIIAVPLIKGGRFAAFLYVHEPEPRVWTDDEVTLAEEVAERTWSAVERARAETALQASERELQQLADTLPVLVSYLDAERRYRFVNRPYELWFKRPKADIVGRHAADVIGAEAYAQVRPHLDRVFAGETITFEQRMTYAPGHDRHVHVDYVPRLAGGRVEGVYALVQDITPAKRAEEKLRHSEALFRGVFDSELMGLTIFDTGSGETLTVNKCFLRMTGHSRADFDEGRWDWREFTLPEYLPLDEAAVAQARERGWWDPFEKEYRRRDGSRFPVRISSAPLPGEPGRVVVSVQDISAMRAAEAELRRSEQRLRLAKQAAGLGVWDWDLVTDEITWSPEMYGLLGVDPSTPATQLYAAWAEALHPEDRAEAEPLVQAAARNGGSFNFDFRLMAGTGEMRWIRSQAVAVDGPDGTPIRLTGVNLDVTAERREKERLHQTAQTLAAAVAERTRERDRIWDLSRDIISVWSIDGVLRQASPAWERILGYPASEAEGRRHVELKHPDDVEYGVRGLSELASGSALSGHEDRYRHADGSYRWISWTAVPQGEVVVAIGRDVTAERERLAELEAAQEALRQSQKMEAMGQLTGGVAHDFNNLLTPIVGVLDLLQRKAVGGEREQRLIANGILAADRAKTLVQRLLAFARRQPLQPVPVDIAKLVTGMSELVASTSGPQIKVVVEAPDGLPPAKADPNQLEMALLNLSVNARDAMPDGGTLRISASAEIVGAGHGSGLRQGAYVRLSVADTGAGMDEATLKRAVEPFFSTKGVGKGTGLGLSMVHGLALQLGGALTIRSRPGLGTNVELWLPRSDAAPEATDAAPGAAPIDASRGTALLVDDEELVRRSTAEMLAELGYVVVEAASGEEAMRLIDSGARFDLLVTDHLMSGINGTDLARATQSVRPGLAMLIISGYAETDGIAADLPRLTKPFRRDELSAALGHVSKRP